MIGTSRNRNPRMQAGEVGKAGTSAQQFSVITGSGVKRAPSIIAQHFCTCRGGIVCICCASWDRRILGSEARRAASLRRQALGNLLRGAM